MTNHSETLRKSDSKIFVKLSPRVKRETNEISVNLPPRAKQEAKGIFVNLALREEIKMTFPVTKITKKKI